MPRKMDKSKRLSIAVSDDLYEWIVGQAEIMGLAPSTYGTVLLNEARRSKDNNEKMMEIMRGFAVNGFDGMNETMKLAMQEAEIETGIKLLKEKE